MISRHRSGQHGPSRRHQAGFSLLELIVTLFVMAIVVTAVLALFDLANSLTSSQVNVAQIQTNQRVAQQEIANLVTMAGMGGLSEGIPPNLAGASTDGVFPTGLGLSVLNNVANGTNIVDGNGNAPEVVQGTDVLIIRGVLEDALYYVEPVQPLNISPATRDMPAATDRITISNCVGPGVIQDLGPLQNRLQEAVTDGRPEAVIVYDRYRPGAFAVLEFDAANSNIAGSCTGASPTRCPTLADECTFQVGLTLAGGATHEDDYARATLGSSLVQGAGVGGTLINMPDGTAVQLPRQIGSIGVLDEFRLYIRESHEIEGNTASPMVPVLARTRFYPFTESPYPDDVVGPNGELAEEIILADNIIDLQVALGVDTNGDEQVLELGAAANDDEVLYNFPSENDGLANPIASPWAAPASEIRFVRFSTVAQADRRDLSRQYLLQIVEDHDYTATPTIFNTGPYAMRRKRIQETTVLPRNLP